MFKLLIVDDEDWIRERLSKTIDWGKMGIEVAGEACDGEEALEMTERLLPDIVITDIRMPCIDGLEYIKRLREGSYDVKIVIISGYSDFEYAQKAIKLGACDYILKPVEDENLISVIKRCAAELDAEKTRELLYKKAEEQIKESQPLLKKVFFMNLVNGYFNSEGDMIRELSYLGIRAVFRNYICFILELDELSDGNRMKSWDERLVQFVMCNIAQDFLNKLGFGDTFFWKTGEVICLVFSDADEKVLAHQVLSVSNGMRKMIKKVIGNSVTIGIGSVCSSIYDLPVCYREARKALQYKSYFGQDRIYDISYMVNEPKTSYIKINDLETLLNNIKMGNKEKAISALEALIKGAYRHGTEIYPLELKLIFMDVMNAVYKTALDADSSINELNSLSIKFFEQLNRLQTVEETHVWLSEAVSGFIDFLGKHKNTKKRKVIEKAVSYINEHFNEPLTLNSVAERFYMNASYFCKVFKEEMGESFTRYFINLRIQKAKELMADPTIKIYELAAMVGYEDVQYFTKIFKSMIGVTPMQYREKIQ